MRFAAEFVYESFVAPPHQVLLYVGAAVPLPHKKALQEAAKKRTSLIGDKSARIAVFTSMGKLLFDGK